MARVPRIGIDAMGGDYGPSVLAAGTALAFREYPEVGPHRPLEERQAAAAFEPGARFEDPAHRDAFGGLLDLERGLDPPRPFRLGQPEAPGLGFFRHPAETIRQRG